MALPSDIRSLRKPARWLALDLFRFVAVVLMVQGHVFYEVVSEAVRAEGWYSMHGYVHGFTAPIFLFSSGIAFGITTLGKWSDHTRWGKPVAKRMERYAVLLALGYGMHLSQFSLSWLLTTSPERRARVLRVDALQCIGMTLAFCELLALAVRRKRPFLGGVGVTMVVIVGAAPWIWAMDLSTWPSGLAAWVNSSTGSMFSLIPWGGFLLAGVLTARFVERRRATQPDDWKQLAAPLLLFGFALIFLGDRMAHSGWEPFPEHNFWKCSPWFFLIRLGVVISVMGGLCVLDRFLRSRSKTPGRVLRFVQVAGQQTLVVYVAHLLVLYGTGFTPGVRRWFHRNLDLWQSIALVACFFVAMGLLAVGWNWIKKHHLREFDRVRYALTALLVLVFLFS